VRSFNPKEDPERYQLINQARETLLDARRRGEYDQIGRSGAQVRVLLDQAALALDRDPQKTLGLLKSAVALAPDMVRPRHLLTQLLMRIQEYELAERQFRWLLQINPNDEMLRCRLARCLMLQKRFPEAETELRRVLALNSAYYDAMLLQARLYQEQGQTGALIQTLETAIASKGREDFTDFNALLQLLLVHLQSENTEDQNALSQRLIAVISEAQIPIALIGLMRAASLLMDREQYLLTQQLLIRFTLLSEKLSPENASTREQFEQQIQQATLAQDSLQIEQDTLLSGAIQECFRVIYRDRSSEQLRQSRMDTAFASLQREFEDDPKGLIQRIDYARREYPKICMEQDTFLGNLRERAVAKVATLPVPSSFHPALSTSDSVDEPKLSLLSRIFGRRAA
jgi:tetratricopeptide (TPR) repeat protein